MNCSFCTSPSRNKTIVTVGHFPTSQTTQECHLTDSSRGIGLIVMLHPGASLIVHLIEFTSYHDISRNLSSGLVLLQRRGRRPSPSKRQPRRRAVCMQRPRRSRHWLRQPWLHTRSFDQHKKQGLYALLRHASDHEVHRIQDGTVRWPPV